MARKERDLFERLRSAGLRKQAARRLSEIGEIGEDASKKAVKAARGAISDLRTLADELERRLPGDGLPALSGGLRSSGSRAKSGSGTKRASSSRSTSSRSGTTRAASTRTRSSRSTGTRSSGSSRSGSTRASSGTRGSRSGASRSARAPKANANGDRAPRGANKAKILKSLQGGPKTASEVAKETGIGTGTVGSTLSKMLNAGEVVKADRGYGLSASSSS